VQRPIVRSPAGADRLGPLPFSRSFASSRRGAALAEHVLLVALVLVGLIGILFGMQAHLARIYTRANNDIGVADCASGGGCSTAGSGGGAGLSGGGSGSSGSASSGSTGTGSGTAAGGVVLGVGDETPTGGPDVSTGSGGGVGGSEPQPGIQVPTQ
jgi:Flp pilus assembly pilin Flp